jgi:hypothetical protein
MSTNQDEPSVSSSGSCAQAEPTPWTITAPPETGEVIDASNAAVWGGDGDLIAEVHSNPAYGVPALDRAKLLAASPELLRVARMAMAFIGKYSAMGRIPKPRAAEAIENLRRAIKQAEGEA